MQSAKLLALVADVGEDLGRRRIGNAWEIDLEKFSISRAISGRVKYSIEIVEDLDLAWATVAGSGAKIGLRTSLVGRVDAGRVADRSVELGVEVRRPVLLLKGVRLLFVGWRILVQTKVRSRIRA